MDPEFLEGAAAVYGHHTIKIAALADITTNLPRENYILRRARFHLYVVRFIKRHEVIECAASDGRLAGFVAKTAVVEVQIAPFRGRRIFRER